MKLHDATFLSFDGDPITGRVPPTLVVTGNNGVLTPSQSAGVAHVYKLFCDIKRVSVSGSYLVQNRILPDGTQVRMTSLNDVDMVRVVPAPVTGVTGENALPSLHCIPADTTNQYGWTKPLSDMGGPINGGKGTVSTLTTDKSEVRAFLKFNSSLDALGVNLRLDRALETVPSSESSLLEDTSSGTYSPYATYAYAPSRYASLLDMGKEWVSLDRKTIVSVSTGGVTVNGVSHGAPSGTLMWACVMVKDLGGGAKKKVLVAVAENASVHVTVAFFTKDLSAAAATAWTAGPTLSSAAFNPTAIHEDIPYTRKGSRNKTGDKCCLWLQCPFPYVRIPLKDTPSGGAGPYTTFLDVDNRGWAWTVEYDVNAGTITTTAAAVEQVTAAYTTSWSASCTGSRQIDAAYVDDTLVYTTLDVTVPSVVQGTNAACTITLTRGSFSVTLTSYAGGAADCQNDALLHYFNDSFVVWKRSMTIGGGGSQSAQHSSIVAYPNVLRSSTPLTLVADTAVTTPNLSVVGRGASANVGTSYSGNGNGYGPWPVLNTLAPDLRNRIFFILNGESFNAPDSYPRSWRPTIGGKDDAWLNYRALEDFYVYTVPAITFVPASGEASGISFLGPMGALGWGWTIHVDNTSFTTLCSDSDLITAYDIDAAHGVLKHLRFL